MNLFALALVGIVLIIDLYVFRGFRNIFPGRNWLTTAYIISSIFTYIVFLSYIIFGKDIYMEKQKENTKKN